MAYVNEQEIVYVDYDESDYELIADEIKKRIEEEGGNVKRKKVSFKKNSDKYVKLKITFHFDF